MKITINIDISGEEIGEILRGAILGAKKEVAKKSRTPTPAKFRKITKERPSLLKEEVPKKRGPGRPRLTPEQQLERKKAKKALKKTNAKVVNATKNKVVKRRWTTQEVAWLRTVAMKGKSKYSISKTMVKKFEKQFGYERSLKSLEMKAQDLLGKRDKYKDKKYGKRK